LFDVVAWGLLVTDTRLSDTIAGSHVSFVAQPSVRMLCPARLVTLLACGPPISGVASVIGCGATDLSVGALPFGIARSLAKCSSTWNWAGGGVIRDDGHADLGPAGVGRDVCRMSHGFDKCNPVRSAIWLRLSN